MTAVGCVNTNAPSGFVFQYQIGLYDCDIDCSAPGAVALDTVSPGDTAWLRHDIVLLQATDTAKRASIRPDCAQNSLVQTPTTNVDTVPTPTCPDSVESRNFVLGAGITRYNRWVVDPALPPGIYRMVGRIMVQPRIEPQFVFVVK